jgi:hypothetical protein
LNNTAENDYNSNKGLLRYYDPMARLLCVELDFAPDIGEYFPDLSTSPQSASNLQDVMSTKSKQGFESTAFV